MSQPTTRQPNSKPTHLFNSVGYARPFTFDQTAAKGNKLLRFLETPSAPLVKDLEKDKAYQPQRFTQSTDIDKNGWVAVPAPPYEPPENLTSLTAIPAVAAMLGAKDCSGVDVHHSESYNVRDKDGKLAPMGPSKAEYAGVYSPRGGVIIATLTESPCNTIKRRGLNCLEPPLRHWSDVTFLVYQDLCKKTVPEASVRGLEHIFRSSVTNEETLAIVKAIVRRRGSQFSWLERSGWAERLVFDVHTEEGRALLGTPNGRGVAWVLVRYREQLGWKRVKRIAVFGMGETKIRRGVSLYFELEDAEERP